MTITTTESVALTVADTVQDFRREHPDTSVQLRVSNGFLDLMRQDADVAVHLMDAPWGNLVGRRVANVCYGVYAVRRLVAGGPLELRAADWVCLDASFAGLPQARWEGEVVPPERVVLRTGSRLVAFDTIANGHAIGILPCALAGRSPDLVPVTGVLDDLTMPLWVVTRRELADVTRIRGLIDFLCEDLERERPLLEA